MGERFFDAFVTEHGNGDFTISYRTGMTTYTEGLRDGVFTALGWNGAGYMPNAHGGGADAAILNPEDYIDRHSFELEIDGQDLRGGWQLEGIDRSESEKNMTVKVVLNNAKRPVRVKVCTLLDGACVLSRWLEIENLSEHSAAVGKMAVLTGGLETTKRWRNHIKNQSMQSPYRLGYFKYTAHMHEGMFRWFDLPNDCFSFGGRYSRLRYRHPFFVLENKGKGTCFIGQLAYSGGYRFTFDVNHENFGLSCDPSACLLGFRAELDAVAPLRVMDAGETIVTPELIIGMVNGDMDEAVNGMHDHVRRSVMYPQPRNRGCWIETAGGGEIEFDKKCVDRAANKGYDIFYIDAGWYFPQGEDALAMTGTWEVDKKRYPNGIRELRDYCHNKGLLLGLWMEPERIGSHSPAVKTHSDHIMNGYNDKNNGGYPIPGTGGMIDLARKESAKWIEDEIVKLIEESGLDMFRLDFNHVYHAPYSYNMKDGYQENSDFRYNENFTAIFKRLRERFPDVIFENCASGGGRTDLGAVKYFSHTWVTDNPVPPRCFDITNGMTMCIPPELIDRLVTTMDAHSMAELDFQMRQMLFVRPTAHHGWGVGTPMDAIENPVQQERFWHFMDLYKNFVTPFIPTSKIYHHTPALNGEDAKGLGILELVAADSSRAMLGVFRLSDGYEEEVEVRFKGIDASKRYRVVLDNMNETFEMSGNVLKYQGIKLAANASLTSELIMLTAID